jgi:two-component system response regulator TctD
MRLLVVEDNAVQRCIIQSMLTDAETEVDSVSDGKAFRLRLLEDEYDVLIIDLSLPDADGLTLIEELRADYDSTPIIVISGRSKLIDKIRCFEAGADDYLVKPFSHVELLVRVRAVTRRSFRIRGALIRVGNLAIDERTKSVECLDHALSLSPNEFKLLLLLARRVGFEVSRESIGSLLGARRGEHGLNAVEKLVSRLRSVIARVNAGVTIRTVRGSGYMLQSAGDAAGALPSKGRASKGSRLA